MSRARRSRFTAALTRPTSNEVERKVILAPNASLVRSHYESQGYTVLEVRAGDYRFDGQRPTGAKPSALGIRQASVMLGLTLPVEVKVVSHKGARKGHHIATPTDPSLRVSGNKVYGDPRMAAPTFKHKITVKSWLNAADMGEVLWHELKHAQQFEREALPGAQSAADALQTWRDLYFEGSSYNQKRHEREAVAAQSNNNTIPLAR